MEEKEPLISTEECPEEEKEETMGCMHYKRKCKLISPCCGLVYTCRFCHDEREDHTLNRRDVQEVTCMKCEARQEARRDCENCGSVFGEYFCAYCKLFDDIDKQQYHCDGCGICRIGGRENFFHCEKCDMCLPVQLQNNHKCIEKVSRSNCTVCLEDIHTSRTPAHIPPCGHLIHRNCFEDLRKAGHYACPTCQVSMVDMSRIWAQLDHEIQTTPIPPECQDYCVNILCRDCHQVVLIEYHVVGLKCSLCGSYNTCMEGAPYRVPGRGTEQSNHGEVGEGGEGGSRMDASPLVIDENGEGEQEDDYEEFAQEVSEEEEGAVGGVVNGTSNENSEC